jgi:hypothetical protein
MSDYRVFGYVVPADVISYSALVEILGFYAKRHDKYEAGRASDRFLFNAASVALVRKEKDRNVEFWVTMSPDNSEPEFLCDLISDKRVEGFYDEPSEKTPLECHESE